jgi:hypothetical protein
MDEWPPHPGPILKSVAVTSREEGFSRMDPRFPLSLSQSMPRTPDTICSAERDVIDMLAGPIAGQRWVSRRFGVLLWIRDFVPELVALTERIETLGGLQRRGPASRLGDWNQVAYRTRWIDPADLAAELKRLTKLVMILSLESSSLRKSPRR